MMLCFNIFLEILKTKLISTKGHAFYLGTIIPSSIKRSKKCILLLIQKKYHKYWRNLDKCQSKQLNKVS